MRTMEKRRNFEAIDALLVVLLLIVALAALTLRSEKKKDEEAIRDMTPT